MVMGGDSRFEGCGFKSPHQILDGHFITFVEKNCFNVCLKKTKNKCKKTGDGSFKKS